MSTQEQLLTGPEDDIKCNSDNPEGNGARAFRFLHSRVEEVLRKNISQISIPMANEIGFWYVQELWDEYKYWLERSKQIQRCSNKDFGSQFSYHMISCWTMMLTDFITSFNLGNSWQEGVKEALQISVCRMFNLEKLALMTHCTKVLVTSIFRKDDLGPGQLYLQREMLALMCDVAAIDHEQPVCFVSACAMNLLCIRMAIRPVPSSVSAKITVDAIGDCKVVFAAQFCCFRSMLHNVSKVSRPTERDMLLAAACLSWLKKIKRRVEVVFTIDEEISHLVMKLPCLIEVAALTQKKLTCCVYWSLAEMLISAVKLYSVEDTLTIMKLYVYDCRLNEILKDYIKISNDCKDWLKCLKRVALRSVQLEPTLKSKYKKCPSLYPSSMDMDKSIKWHLKYSEIFRSVFEAERHNSIIDNCLSIHIEINDTTGDNHWEDMWQDVPEYRENKNTEIHKGANISQVICSL